MNALSIVLVHLIFIFKALLICMSYYFTLEYNSQSNLLEVKKFKYKTYKRMVKSYESKRIS